MDKKINKVISKDGTSIAYWQLGEGPGLVLVQGAGGTAYNFKELAEALAEHFTVYVAERRGRGESGQGKSEYTMQREVEDLQAILQNTRAHWVFGVSAGGLIALETARVTPAIQKLAVYEPALFTQQNLPVKQIEQINVALKQGDYPIAMITAMRAGQLGPGFMWMMPDWLLILLVKLGIKQEAKKGTGGYASIIETAKTLKDDFQLAASVAGQYDRYKYVDVDTVLLGGSESPQYLKYSLTQLTKVMPHTSRIEVPGVGHAAPWNAGRGGKPERVANELMRIFTP